MALRFPFSILSIALLVLRTWADEGYSGHFGYAGPNGPQKWGSISPSYSACSNGRTQSPVDVTKNSVVSNKKLKPIRRDYYPANATLVNNGFNIGVHFEGKVGGVTIDGKEYPLKQMHWHSPAEHRVDGRQVDAELHLVHQTEDGSTAVVAVLYQLGDSDPIISKIENKLVELAKKGASNEEAHVALGIFDVRHMKRKTRRYYRYVGSFTTPPCKENVTWNILGKVRSLSNKQLKLLKAPLSPEFKNNARPVQPLNGRKIDMYHDQSTES